MGLGAGRRFGRGLAPARRLRCRWLGLGRSDAAVPKGIPFRDLGGRAAITLLGRRNRR